LYIKEVRALFQTAEIYGYKADINEALNKAKELIHAHDHFALVNELDFINYGSYLNKQELFDHHKDNLNFINQIAKQN
jgi:hypothetical protein